MSAPSDTYNQNDLLLWSLYLCGGADNWVDVEALFLKAFELGPASLSWRTRLDIPDYKKCSKALQSLEDGKRSTRSEMIVKRDRYNRMLNAEGAEWCRRYETSLSSLYQGKPQFSKTSEHGRRVATIVESDLFASWMEGGDHKLNLLELGQLLKCGAHTTRANWDKRLNAILEDATLVRNEEVVSFVARSFTLLDENGVR